MSKVEMLLCQLSTGTGTQTFTLSDSSLTPNCIIILGRTLNSLTEFSTHFSYVMGAWAGTTNKCINTVSLDSRTTTSSYRRADSSYCYAVRNSAGSVVQSFTIDSVDAGEFTINKAANDNNSRYFHAICIECEDAEVQEITTAWPLAEKTYNFSFEPNSVICFNALGINNQNHCLFSLGFTDFTTTRSAAVSCRQGQTTSITNSRIDDEALYLATYNDFTWTKADFVSLVGSGLTLDTVISEGSQEQYGFLVGLKGLYGEVEPVTYPSVTGVQTINTTNIQDPIFALEMTTNQTGINVLNGGATMMISAFDGTNQITYACTAEDAQGTTDCDRYFSGNMADIIDYNQNVIQSASGWFLSNGLSREFTTVNDERLGAILLLGDQISATPNTEANFEMFSSPIIGLD